MNKHIVGGGITVAKPTHNEYGRLKVKADYVFNDIGWYYLF